jgi:plastocyanin
MRASRAIQATRALAAIALILGSFAAATPVAAGDPCYHDFDIPPRSEGTDPQVKLLPCAFAPTVVRVRPGTTVEFFSGPYDVHLITGAGQEWGSRDDEIQPNSMVSYRFVRAGTYPYACALHRGMSGTIVVGDGIAASAAAGSGPAVVTVVRATGPKASAAPSAVAAAPLRNAVPSAAAAGVPVATTEETTPASASSSLVPLAAVAVLLLAGATVVAVRVIGGRRAHRQARARVPLDG